MLTSNRSSTYLNGWVYLQFDGKRLLPCAICGTITRLCQEPSSTSSTFKIPGKMSSPYIHSTLKRTNRLRYFYPFVDWAYWALLDINLRIAPLGVKNPKQVLDPTVFSSPSRRISVADEMDYALQLSVIKRVVSQAEWLTWNEYLELVIVSDCGGYKQTAAALLDWTKQPRELQKKIRFLSLMMKQEDVKRFKPVLDKVIRTYLLEVEMRKRYPAAVCKRYRDFEESGRSLKFGWDEIEEENKAIESKSLENVGAKDRNILGYEKEILASV